jgi:hypothetical protein
VGRYIFLTATKSGRRKVSAVISTTNPEKYR